MAGLSPIQSPIQSLVTSPLGIMIMMEGEMAGRVGRSLRADHDMYATPAGDLLEF
jgi:hypothetical protein